MRWTLLIETYGSDVVHKAGITNTVVTAFSRLNIGPTYNVSDGILKGLDGNDYIHGKNMP